MARFALSLASLALLALAAPSANAGPITQDIRIQSTVTESCSALVDTADLNFNSEANGRLTTNTLTSTLSIACNTAQEFTVSVTPTYGALFNPTSRTQFPYRLGVRFASPGEQTRLLRLDSTLTTGVSPVSLGTIRVPGGGAKSDLSFDVTQDATYASSVGVYIETLTVTVG